MSACGTAPVSGNGPAALGASPAGGRLSGSGWPHEKQTERCPRVVIVSMLQDGQRTW